MKNKEFNLSKERERLRKYLKEQFGEKSIIPDDILNFIIQKDKEFIRLLKEKLDKDAEFCRKGNIIPSVHPRRVKEWIDKLAGEK